jgi:hypothetical protein
LLNKPDIILAHGQTLREYQTLHRLYTKKLAESGFDDIETNSALGFYTPFLKGSRKTALKAAHDAQAHEYFRLAGLFLHNYDFSQLADRISIPMARFLWSHYADGKTLKEIVAAFATTYRAPLERLHGKGKQVPPSLFWVFTKFDQVLEPAFLKWIKDGCGGLMEPE